MRTYLLIAAAAMVAAPLPAQHDHHAASAGSHATATRTVATGGRAAPVVTIVAKDYAFAAPDTVEAGTTVFKFSNAGKELHHATLIRFDEGKTLADFVQLMSKPMEGPPPTWAVDVGGPQAQDPGRSGETAYVLTPGNYAWVCFIPSPDKMPHVAKGMMKGFTVVPARGAAATELPAAGSTLTLVDYGFDFSKPLVAGKQTVRVVNTASQSHEIVLVKLEPGKKAMDVIQWIDAPNGPPPGSARGGMGSMAPGAVNTMTLDLEPGEYALICFIGDAKDGKPHFMHGMTREIVVK